MKSGSAEFGSIGTKYGAKTHTLSIAEIPSHSHAGAWYDGPEGTVIPNRARLVAGVPMSIDTNRIGATGGGGAHLNVQPTAVALVVIKT